MEYGIRFERFQAEGEFMMEKAIFGAGCFWGVEEEFAQTKGVTATRVGYAGGNVPRPTYEEVCSGMTGHVEAVEVEFNNDMISYEELLDKFWDIHSAIIDPKWSEKIGRQYQSVIFYQSDEQKKAALEKKKNLNVSTSIEPFKNFYPAEERHQQYLKKRRLKAG